VAVLGDIVARGTRSSIHAYGRGAVVKVPHPSTPTEWIHFEAQYAEAARAAGAPVPRLLGIDQIFGRAASVWERVEGTSMWQRVVDQPERSAELGRLLADVQRALFELVPPVTLPNQRDRPRPSMHRLPARSTCCLRGWARRASATATCIRATSSWGTKAR
jgi:aminoglycoside phosphotransferase (APT) family kinase protein